MKLQTGIYKVQLKTLIEEFAILQVYDRDQKVYYRINNGPENEIDWLAERNPCIVIKQLNRLNIQSARIEIKFRDDEGDYYSFPASNVTVVRQLFQTFPEVAKALGSKTSAA